MKAYHLHIEGIVQGVGFRPYVYRLANKFKLNGWVNNTSDGVHIHIEGDDASCQSFINELNENPPKHAFIKKTSVQTSEIQFHQDFTIVNSETNQDCTVLLTPDYAICPDCESELFDQTNRRYRYPFITCTLCGPRYSIIDGLPYDRPKTVMSDYPMCRDCQKEYDEVMDRRYFSQTNSCDECGFELKLYDKKQLVDITDGHSNETILNFVNTSLAAGRIVAVKGIGGYLLLCDATNSKAIDLLRARKLRPKKPFAVIYPDAATLQDDFTIDESKLALYNSAEAPIILLTHHQELPSGVQADKLAPGLNQLGVMRSYAPLLTLISSDFKKPLVATSGNITGSPIIFKNEMAIDELSSIADLVLTHNRDILIPQDDSVVKFAQTGSKIWVRRSRGLAPNYLSGPKLSCTAVLGMGASMKGTFSIQHADNTYVSQYLGDLDSYDAQISYERTLDHISKTLQFKPEIILVDKHPSYASTAYGEVLANECRVPIQYVQHHEAHFAAVLGEHDYMDTKEPVLGIIWDGTGYGNDQQIWGGEFLLFKNLQFSRFDHLQYFPHILGDKMSREPRISALSVLSDSPYQEEIASKFEAKEFEYYKRILKQPSLQTSSVGRLFDAAACVLGLVDKLSYEGEGAMLLEQLATPESNLAMEISVDESQLLSPQYYLEAMIQELDEGLSNRTVAYNFHYRLVKLIGVMAKRSGVGCLAFSGGVFQNALLVEIIEKLLSADYKLLFHQSLSPNDENVSFGQLIHYEIAQRREKRSNMARKIESVI